MKVLFYQDKYTDAEVRSCVECYDNTLNHHAYLVPQFDNGDRWAWALKCDFCSKEIIVPLINIYDGLNDLERKVLRSCVKSSEGNGHDFGFTEDVIGDKDLKNLTKQQIGGYLSQLEKKGKIHVEEPQRVNDVEPWSTQLTIPYFQEAAI